MMVIKGNWSGATHANLDCQLTRRPEVSKFLLLQVFVIDNTKEPAGNAEFQALYQACKLELAFS